jgi:multidrug efflux pump subunit AcrA (membrane-fusion protein)
LSLPKISQPGDPLATLRIDRSGRARSRWFGKLVAVGVLLGCLAACGWAWLVYGEELTRPRVKVASVEVRAPGAADAVLSAQGYLKSEKQAAVGAKAPGRVLKVYVREGQAVAKDEVLAELEHADIDQTLEAMQASLTAMDASKEAMRLSLEKARAELAEVESMFQQDDRDFARVEKLFKTGQLSTAEYEQAESKRRSSRSRRDSMTAAVAVCQARLQEAEARCLESQARHRETQQQRRNLFVHAPFKGIVISKEAEEGESILPGGMGAASGRGSVVTLADLLHLEVETDVKEDYVNRVKRDQPVSISVDAVPNRRFGGRVRTIIPMGDRAKGTVRVKVQLHEAEVREVNDPETETFTLFPEMAATVHFLSEVKANPSGATNGSAASGPAMSGPILPQVTVPAAALQTEGNGKFVWTVVEDRVSRVTIEADEAKDGRVLVRRGLKGGERVVIDPPANLRDDLRVKTTQ